jgi:hypothetical protein
MADLANNLSASPPTLVGSPTVSFTRHAPTIGLSATIVRAGFRGVKATSPLIEFLADGVDPPTMICCAEILPIGHLRDRSELSRAELMSWQSKARRK